LGAPNISDAEMHLIAKIIGDFSIRVQARVDEQSRSYLE